MINLPSLTVAALINGLNPCGIGMMITFLGYLMVFGTVEKSEKLKVRKTLISGLVYIWAVFLAYLLIGLLFYGLAFYLQRLFIAKLFKWVIGLAVGGAGLIQLKDALWPDSPIHLRMSDKASRVIEKMLAKMSIPMAFLVGLATTAFSTPCMLPLYVGTATMVANSGWPIWLVVTSFLYYNLIFVLPLILVLVVMVKGKDVVMMKEWSHKNKKLVRLVMGGVMTLVGYLIVR